MGGTLNALADTQSLAESASIPRESKHCPRAQNARYSYDARSFGVCGPQGALWEVTPLRPYAPLEKTGPLVFEMAAAIGYR